MVSDAKAMNDPASSQETSTFGDKTPENANRGVLSDETQDGVAPVSNDYPTGLRLIMILLGLVLTFFLSALDMSIIGTAVPRITTEFNSIPDVGWYGASFMMTLAAFQSHWGKAYLYFPLRPSFLASIAVFEIGSLVCAVAPNSLALIIGRAIQGAGAAGITGGCYTIASFIVPPTKVPAVVGLLGSVFTLASVAGPLLGGVFTDKATWRWCFYINLPIGGVALACLIFFFRTPEASKSMHGKLTLYQIALNFDPIGTVLLLSSLICFILAMQWGGISKAWDSATVIGLIVGWGVMSVLFAINEWYQGDNALVVYRILKVRSIGTACGFIFFMMCGNLALYYNLPIYFQAISGDTPLQSGLKFIPTILATSICTFLSSTFIGKVGFFQPWILAGSILQTIGVGLYYTWGLNTNLGPVIGFQIIYGIGAGLGVQASIIVGQSMSSIEDRSITLATICFFQFVSGAYGVSATDSVLNNILLKKLVHYVSHLHPEEVLAVGATGIDGAFQGDELIGVQKAFLDGVRASLVLTVAFLGVAVLWALTPRWPGRLIPPTPKTEEAVNDSREKSDIA